MWIAPSEEDTDNANYLWIQLSHAALNAKSRAGFVMANSASEQEIRRQLIATETGNPSLD